MPAIENRSSAGAGHARDRLSSDRNQNEKPKPITGPLIVRSNESLPFSKS